MNKALAQVIPKPLKSKVRPVTLTSRRCEAVREGFVSSLSHKDVLALLIH